MQVWDGITPWRKKRHWDAPVQGRDADEIVDEIIRTQESLNLLDAVYPSTEGGIGDGQIHYLNEKYKTLTDAKKDYPFVTDITTQTIDWAAITKIIKSGKSVALGYYKNYIVTNDLLAVDIPRFRIIGQGIDVSKITSYTGGHALELYGSYGWSLQNFSLYAFSADVIVSTGRTDAQPYCEYTHMKKVRLSGGHKPTANGGKGSFAFYNNASEIALYQHCEFACDKAVVVSGDNIYNVQPTAPRAAGFTSCSAIVFQACTFSSFDGPGLTLSGTVNVSCTDWCYFSAWLVEEGGYNTFKYAVACYNLVREFNLQAHIEFFTRIMLVDHSIVTRLKVHVSCYPDLTGATEGIITLDSNAANGAAPAGLLNFELDVMNYGSNAHNLIGVDTAGGFNYNIQNGRIMLDPTAGIKTRGGYVTGLLIWSELDNPTNIVIGQGTGFGSAILMTRQGTRILGGFIKQQTFLAYSASISFSAGAGSDLTIIPTNTTAFTINAPTNPQNGQEIEFNIVNQVGTLGVLTWDPIFKMTAWTQPANGFNRSIRFKYNGANWREMSRTPSDIPN